MIRNMYTSSPTLEPCDPQDLHVFSAPYSYDSYLDTHFLPTESYE